MVSDSCILVALPDDVFAVVSRSLSPRDLCNLSLCSKSLGTFVASEKVWLTQCERVGLVPHRDLLEWRKGVSSYKGLCRFLVSVRALTGVWVNQNPELGNLVYVLPGFVSVVGCRIIPQELCPLGIEEGPILWVPVFEVVGDYDGSMLFFLHAREEGSDYLYPGSVKSVNSSCNVLFLEVEPIQGNTKLFRSKSLAYQRDANVSRKICRSDSGVSRLQRGFGRNEAIVPFNRLAFGDRRNLLQTVCTKVRFRVPDGPLFPRLGDDIENFQKDMMLLLERRSLLLRMLKLTGRQIDRRGCSDSESGPTQSELNENLRFPTCVGVSRNEDVGQTHMGKRKSVGTYFRNGIKQIFGKSIPGNDNRVVSKNHYLRQMQLDGFLKSGDTLGLKLQAAAVKLASYRAWPTMDDSHFSLYKLPLRVPRDDHEYAGLWGGTFGWPPGKRTEGKPGKALFLLLLSYEESKEGRLLIATKILEGTHYVLHPNGSAMFTVNIDKASLEPFPWDIDADSLPVTVQHAFKGEGIANGYGFRYPGSKPGSLFAIQNRLLAFVWKQSRAVLTLQRLNMQHVLKQGERYPALPPIANFSYLTKTYANIYTSFSDSPS